MAAAFLNNEEDWRSPTAGEPEEPPGAELVVRTSEGGYVDVEESAGTR